METENKMLRGNLNQDSATSCGRILGSKSTIRKRPLNLQRFSISLTVVKNHLVIRSLKQNFRLYKMIFGAKVKQIFNIFDGFQYE
jgi:hypothetical protein